MASPSARRAKARRRERVPPRAARYARSPKPPEGALLRYRMAMRQVVALVAQAVRSELYGKLDRYAKADDERVDAADGGGPMSRLGPIVAKRIEKSGLGKTLELIAGRTVQHSKGEFKRLGIKLREAEPKFGPLITDWRKSNIARIISLVGQELDTIGEVLEGAEGLSVKALQERIEERLDVTRSKAELLARDQTLKLNSQINRERQTAAGISEFIWTTSGDERVRESHAELDGQRFSWDDLPEVDGEKVAPGEQFQCRCVADPVLPELEDEPNETEEP